MKKQKIIKVGNSYGVLLSRDTMEQMQLKEGDELYTSIQPEIGTMILKSPHAVYMTDKKKSVKKWLSEFVADNNELLTELSHTK
jgi:putative addiction module antidote